MSINAYILCYIPLSFLIIQILPVVHFMSTSLKKIALLFCTIYSFFTCFIMNVFGYTLGYDKLIYEWNILNINEGRRVLFNQAILHFFMFAVCLFLNFRMKMNKHGNFKKLESQDNVFEEQGTV